MIAAAHVRRGRAWIDVSILNISSRGLQIHTGSPLEKGGWVELRRGEHVIHAQVVWQDGNRVGLQSEERLPVEDIAGEEIDASFRTAEAPRKARLRTGDQNRLRGRAFEFAGVVSIAVLLAFGIFIEVQESFARPLTIVAAALR